jgi:anaerobic magnesium-protoporphyrin IX monomethyl ester cyclase
MDTQAASHSAGDPRIMIVTMPIRPVPTEYPPLGSLSVIRALAKAGHERVEFFDIDGLRPQYDEVLAHIRAARPDVLGISAVVSTAYDYTKRLSLDVKRMLPETTIVLGGNLAASAEILLRRTGVDFCVLGEGERIIVNFMKVFAAGGRKRDYVTVRGLMYLDGDQLVNTGYEDPIPKEEVYDVDWTVLEKFSRIDNFIQPATESMLVQATFSNDRRAYEPHRRNKAVGTLVASKGCVAKCTFCHRWDRGIRYIPVPILMDRIRELVERYNVGFITWGDENFGTDRRWLAEFCQEIKQFDILWRVSGMRVNCISPAYLRMMKDAGCSAVYFGMETGSARMLQIMEKNVKLEDNYNAIKWTLEEGLDTTIQLVFGMPGETPDTVRETGDFVAYASQLQADKNPMDLSINYAQALPGTPLYEFARTQGLIGQTLDAEEQYLLGISDRDASDEATTINFTNYSRLTMETWRPLTIMRAAVGYIEKFGTEAYRAQLLKSRYFEKAPYFNAGAPAQDPDGQPVDERTANAAQHTGYFNSPKREVESSHVSDTVRRRHETVVIEGDQLPGLWRLVVTAKWRAVLVVYPTLCYRLRALLPIMVLMYDYRHNGLRYAVQLAADHIAVSRRRLRGAAAGFAFPYKSLRRIVNQDLAPPALDNPAMLPLRRGR